MGAFSLIVVINLLNREFCTLKMNSIRRAIGPIPRLALDIRAARRCAPVAIRSSQKLHTIAVRKDIDSAAKKYIAARASAAGVAGSGAGIARFFESMLIDDK